jgi:hypothetical protein
VLYGNGQYQLSRHPSKQLLGSRGNRMAGLIPQPSLWRRVWKGAVIPCPLEEYLLYEFVERMPVNFQPILRSQLASYNLAQRDPDYIELRFYRIIRGRVDRRSMPLLPIRAGEVKLFSVTAQIPDVDDPLNASFWAVDRRFFMVNFGCSIKPYKDLSSASIEKTRQSWRSNVERGLTTG